MDKMQNYMTARMFAREYGTLLGGVWVVMFAGTMMSVRTGGLLPTLLMLCATFGCVILPFVLASRYKNKPFNAENGISFFHAYYFSFIMFFYASLLSAAATFIYFQWMDHGMFLESMNTALAELEKNKGSLPQGMEEIIDKEKELIGSIAGMNIKPVEQALGIFNQGIFGGLVVSLLTALAAKREPETPPLPPQ